MLGDGPASPAQGNVVTAFAALELAKLIQLPIVIIEVQF
jgi:hypothetical protein